MASEAGVVSGLAERYASALYELADEQKALDRVADDLRRFRRLVAESADLGRVLRSPLLNRDVQARAVGAVATAAELSPLVQNLLGVLARHRRLYAADGVAEGFLRLLAARRGEVTAEVTSAVPLNDNQVEAVTEALRGVVGGKVAVNQKVDPGLLGGLVVKVGSRLFDSSLRTKLRRLELAMKGVG